MRQYRFADLLGQVPKDEYFKRLDDFCDHLDMSQSQAYKYMRASWEKPVNMPIATLLKAADFFGLSIDQIINHPTTVPV